MKLFREFDWLLLLGTIILCAAGLLLIYSVFHPYHQSSVQEEHLLYLKKQALWLLFGFIALAVGFFFNFRYFETLAFAFYVVCIVLLVVVLVMHKGDQAYRWIVLGPIRIQPSEFSKIALIMVWARVLSGHGKDPHGRKALSAVFLLFIIPFLLVLKEPDLGTAIILFVLMLAVLYWKGFSGLYIFFIISPLLSALLSLYGDKQISTYVGGEVLGKSWPLGVYLVGIFILAYLRRANLVASVALVVSNIGVCLAYPLVWNHLKGYQQARIINFLYPSADKLGKGWQVLQSKVAIGSGGLSGKGFLLGTQKALEFIPARHTDFIFSVLGEEVGFIGELVILSLFALVIARALAVAVKTRSEFASIACAGIAVYFFSHVFINVAMTIGIAPVTGIPLPFLSYGGSSLVVSLFLVGFLLNCGSRWYEY